MLSCSRLSYEIKIEEIPGDTKNVNVFIYPPDKYDTKKEEDLIYINSIFPKDSYILLKKAGVWRWSPYIMIINRNDVSNLIHGDK